MAAEFEAERVAAADKLFCEAERRGLWQLDERGLGSSSSSSRRSLDLRGLPEGVAQVSTSPLSLPREGGPALKRTSSEGRGGPPQVGTLHFFHQLSQGVDDADGPAPPMPSAEPQLVRPHPPPASGVVPRRVELYVDDARSEQLLRLCARTPPPQEAGGAAREGSGSIL